jgi:two-component system, response regulator PdtaR
MTEGLRIVIVEDDALIAMDLADLLIGMGHDVRAIAATEAEAVDAAIRHDPDLMIVDGNLAEGSGVSAMRSILARRFVSHLYVTGDPLALLQALADAIVVAKPFRLRDLAAGIARARHAAHIPCAPPA